MYLTIEDVLSFGIDIDYNLCSVIANLFNRALDQVDEPDCNNFRLSVNHKQDREYWISIIEEMSYGSFDNEVILNDGTSIKYGFNYNF